MKKDIITYESLLAMASSILESDVFDVKRTLITYTLPNEIHNQLDEELFIRGGGKQGEYEHTDIIEVEIASVMFNFIIG